MELKRTTIKRREVYVMFTGDNYFFYSNYYGTLAIAERKEKKTGEPPTEEFTLTVGNHHTTGGQMADSIVISAAKRYINREENQFVIKRVKYNIKYSDLANGYLTANYLTR